MRSDNREQLVDDAVNHDTTSKTTAPLTILKKIKLQKSGQKYGSGTAGGSGESVASGRNIARCLTEKQVFIL